MIPKIKDINTWNTGLSYAYDYVHLEIVQLMIEAGATNIYSVCKWPRNKREIVKLLEFKTRLDAFSKIGGYELLKKQLLKVNKSIVKSGVLIPDLLMIIAKCIII